jgi:hypothetical protein
LTVQYLCFAFDVPWSTFKRWKNEAFVDKVYVPAHKGKSVITDKPWASQVFNARRMFISHSMTLWLTKHPAMKNDKDAKKVIHNYRNAPVFARKYKRTHASIGKADRPQRTMEPSRRQSQRTL